MNHHQTLIEQAIEHIRDAQSRDGGFISLSSFLPDDFSNAIPRRTTFFTSNILTCLQNIPGNTTDIQKTAIAFLLSQKNEQWSFNYWARSAANETAPPYPPYPDDLDDTFAALAAIARYDATLIDGRAFSAIANMLTAREIRRGGPYKTWLVAGDAPAEWQNVDPVINGTIGYFLSLINVKLPELEHFIGEVAQKNRLSSPYYPGIFHVGYFLSRFCSNARGRLANIIAARLNQENGEGITTLERAMAISSLMNLDHPEKVSAAAVDLLTARLGREGFRPYAFCIDPARDGKRCFAGTSALTAAFCAEALARYSLSRETHPPIGNGTLHDHIRSIARAACQDVDSELRTNAMMQIEKTSDERITMLAYDFREVLHRNKIVIPCDITETLSLANLYGWMAYKIYDDVLDDEDGAALIPCANYFLRMLARIYGALEPRIPGAKLLFENTMNHIDSANSWEQKHCRYGTATDNTYATQDAVLPRALPAFGDHATLADRSIGHAMSPLAEMLFAGYSAESTAYKKVELFFRHYLIARQFHDDAHDWADDLLRGRMNSVGTLALNRFKKKYPERAAGATAKEALPELKKIFWEETIEDVASLIIEQVAKARKTRESLPLLNGSDLMEGALRKLEDSARRAVKERDEALIFLKFRKDFPPPGAPAQNPLIYR